MKKAVVFFADGFEEVEALTVCDALMRAGVKVVKAAVGGSLTVTSSHDVKVVCDALVEDIKDEMVDLVFAPGGMPGSSNLAQSWPVNEMIVRHVQDRLVAAICAAPAVVLGPLGLLEGRKATCFPGCEEYAPSVVLTVSWRMETSSLRSLSPMPGRLASSLLNVFSGRMHEEGSRAASGGTAEKREGEAGRLPLLRLQIASFCFCSFILFRWSIASMKSKMLFPFSSTYRWTASGMSLKSFSWASS